MNAYTDSPLWNAQLNRKMWELYLRDRDDGMLEYASPMLTTNFSNLPPAYMEVAEFDCLRNESIAYAQSLKAADVEVQLENVYGTFYGVDFFSNKEVS